MTDVRQVASSSSSSSSSASSSLLPGQNPRRRRTRKRGYSRDFSKQPDSHRYLLDHIPAKLWTTAARKARRKGISMRALLLQLLTEWNEQ
jgi:hypothetical protein